MIDGHMHLEYGPLDIAYVLEFVEGAKKKGISKIQILDHTHRFKEFLPIYEELREIPEQKEWLDKKELDSVEDFITLMNKVKKMNLDVEITYGLEVCYTPKHEAFLRDTLNQYSFDFLVGAVHSIDGILYDMSFSRKLLWDVQDVNLIYKRYYELVFDLIKSDLFTQLAHPDTIKLFKYYPTYDLTPTYHELARLLNDHSMKAENNTGCHYRYQHPDEGLSETLLAILKEHNVSMITASDAHYPDHVGTWIAQIWDKTML